MVNSPLCDPNHNNGLSGYCPAYTYIPNIESPVHGILDPYFDIANTYGFANWMWQTNQGPSFPAHQFLFSGTSAPAAFSQTDTYYKWFVAENPSWPGHANQAGDSTGCSAASTAYARIIDTNASEGTCPLVGDNMYCAYPCYFHPTLATDVLETNGLSWRYYARDQGSLWTAPNSFQTICGPPYSGSCNLQEWTDHVGSYLPIPNPIEAAPILRDIERCDQDFPAVAWVIPDGYWSDHPGYDPLKHPGTHDGGPSWVAHIVNAVGNHTCSPGNTHDVAKWTNTVILIVWDDWGGFYDHVSPDISAGGPGIGYPDGNGGPYVHGFRVPLLVVSAYGTPHYISGPTSNPQCVSPNSSPYCHDFGSILNFIEFTFGTGGTPLNEVDAQYNYPYADHWAPDAVPYCVSRTACPYSLSDFFADFDQAQPFTPITSWKYPETCFHNPDQSGCFPGYKPEDADDDADDTQ